MKCNGEDTPRPSVWPSAWAAVRQRKTRCHQITHTQLLKHLLTRMGGGVGGARSLAQLLFDSLDGCEHTAGRRNAITDWRNRAKRRTRCTRCETNTIRLGSR